MQPLKKRAKLADDDLTSLWSDLSYTGPCLLPLLQPVRVCRDSFLSAQDAVRFMRASHSITAALLADYAFVDRVFTFRSVADVKRSRFFCAAVKHSLARYARYHMRILRMCLPEDWYSRWLTVRLVDRCCLARWFL